MEKLPTMSFLGSTAIFFRPQPGQVLKAPVKILQDQVVPERPSVAHKYIVERQILDRLGEHPRIVGYFGWCTEFPTGLLLAEASHGSLQSFLDNHNDAVPLSLRKKWFRPAIEAIAYIHSRGVIHSDLRPENFLVHGIEPSLDLWLCDFDGSSCEDLGLDGGGLPDAGFFDPNSPLTSTTPASDIFSLGSVLYTILTGHWLYRSTGGLFSSPEEMEKYETHVETHFRQGNFPDVTTLYGGEIIMGCWLKKYSDSKEIMQQIESADVEQHWK